MPTVYVQATTHRASGIELDENKTPKDLQKILLANGQDIADAEIEVWAARDGMRRIGRIDLYKLSEDDHVNFFVFTADDSALRRDMRRLEDEAMRAAVAGKQCGCDKCHQETNQHEVKIAAGVTVEKLEDGFRIRFK